MRLLTLTPLVAVAALIAMQTDAEAKRRGFGFFSSPAKAAPIQPRAGMPDSAQPSRFAPGVIVPIPRMGSANASPAAGLAAGGAAAVAAASMGSANRAAAAPPTTAAAPAAVAPTPREWCPSKRVVGQGAGFCEIN